MAQLLDLPDELIINIISHVQNRTDALRLVCLTCRRLQNVAEPILYNTLHILESHRHRANKIVSLSSTLVNRAQLARGVKHLDIYLEHKLADRLKGIDLAPTLQTIQHAHLKFFDDSDSDEHWWAGIPTVYPHVLLFLALLPRLETFTLRGPDVNIAQFKHLAISRGVDLRSLRSIDIACPDSDSTYNIADTRFLVPLLQTASLKKCILRRVFLFLTFGKDAPSLHLAPGSLSITHLELHDCIADAKSLEDLILATRELRNFTFRAPAIGRELDIEIDEAREDPGFDEIDLATVHRALGTHGETLEVLDFRFNDLEREQAEEEYDNETSSPVDNQLPPFSGFDALRDLTMDYYRLSSTAHLPHGLRKLVLLNRRAYEPELCTGIEELCVLKRDVCPQLEWLDVQIGTSGYYGMILRNALEECGFRSEQLLIKDDAGFIFRVHIGVYG